MDEHEDSLGARAILGVLVFMAGVLASTIGTFLYFVGFGLFDGMRREPRGTEIPFTLLWLAGSCAVLFAGALLLRSSRKGTAFLLPRVEIAWRCSALSSCRRGRDDRGWDPLLRPINGLTRWCQ